MANSRLQDAVMSGDEELKLDISPMIDMVFLLIIFFMVASRFIDQPVDLDVKIPIASSANVTEDARGRLLINVRGDGTFTLGVDTIVDMDGLSRAVERARLSNQGSGYSTKVLIRGDRNTSMRYIKQAIQAAGNGGVSEVVFANFVVPPSGY